MKGFSIAYNNGCILLLITILRNRSLMLQIRIQSSADSFHFFFHKFIPYFCIHQLRYLLLTKITKEAFLLILVSLTVHKIRLGLNLLTCIVTESTIYFGLFRRFSAEGYGTCTRVAPPSLAR